MKWAKHGEWPQNLLLTKLCLFLREHLSSFLLKKIRNFFCCCAKKKITTKSNNVLDFCFLEFQLTFEYRIFLVIILIVIGNFVGKGIFLFKVFFYIPINDY